MKKIYTKEEIDALPDSFKLSNGTKILIVFMIVLFVLGLSGIVVGSIFIALYGAVEWVILITFAVMGLIFSLMSPIFVNVDKSKNKKLKIELIHQALNEVFNGKVIYDPISRINSAFLKETDICPFLVKGSGEKIIVQKGKQSVSILEIESLSNMDDLVSFLLAAPELGVVGSAFLGTASLISKIADKSIASSKFKGTVMVFPNLSKKINSIVEVRSKKFLTPLSSLLNSKDKFETESIKVNEKYNFYATNLQDGFEIIKPTMIEVIDKVNETLKNGFVMVFKEDYMIIGFSEEKIIIKDLIKNNNVMAKKAYYDVKNSLNKYENIVDLFTYLFK